MYQVAAAAVCKRCQYFRRPWPMKIIDTIQYFRRPDWPTKISSVFSSAAAADENNSEDFHRLKWPTKIIQLISSASGR
jgi:hypothetical protein